MNITLKKPEPEPQHTFIVFNSPDGEEILKIVGNGDIFYKGELVDNDKKITDGLREFLNSQNKHNY